MCRLLGVIANKDVNLEFSMLEARDSFKSLGKAHPDGWGLGWYEDGKAVFQKHGESSFLSARIDELVKNKTSKIFIAHVRRRSGQYGPPSKENAHPFLHDNWIFAHNGTVDRKALLKHLSERYLKNIESKTDSEVYFRLILQKMGEQKDQIQGIREAVSLAYSDKGMNFVLSNGHKLFAFRFGRELHYLKRFPTSPFCASSNETQAVIKMIESKRSASEKAILVCSQALTDEHWIEVQNGKLMIFDTEPSITFQDVVLEAGTGHGA